MYAPMLFKHLFETAYPEAYALFYRLWLSRVICLVNRMFLYFIMVMFIFMFLFILVIDGQ